MKTQETIPGTRDIAQRLVNAEAEFAESLTHYAMVSLEDAYKAMYVMLKLKVAKREGLNRINVKHGAYLDHEPICNAIAIANKVKR
jgi:hypothetical protein